MTRPAEAHWLSESQIDAEAPLGRVWVSCSDTVRSLHHPLQAANDGTDRPTTPNQFFHSARCVVDYTNLIGSTLVIPVRGKGTVALVRGVRDESHAEAV